MVTERPQTYRENMAAKNQEMKVRFQEETETPRKSEGFKGGWLVFWLVFGLAFGKDLLDVFVALLDAAGLALQALPIIGTAAGIGLAFIAEALDKISGLFID